MEARCGLQSPQPCKPLRRWVLPSLQSTVQGALALGSGVLCWHSLGWGCFTRFALCWCFRCSGTPAVAILAANFTATIQFPVEQRPVPRLLPPPVMCASRRLYEVLAAKYYQKTTIILQRLRCPDLGRIRNCIVALWTQGFTVLAPFLSGAKATKVRNRTTPLSAQKPRKTRRVPTVRSTNRQHALTK